jgi:EAL domain-containing protein (putative c-di-GMP-specific phosphodiesterase class I)/GGDEF domain-containing protein
MTLPDNTTVAIHSDDEGTLERLSTILRGVAGVRLVDGEDGRRISLVDTRAAEAVATVRRLVEGGGTCVAVSDGADLDAIVEMLQAGATGCVATRADADTLQRCMAAAVRGTVTLPAEVARSLAARAASGSPSAPGRPAIERALLELVIAERRFDIVAQPIVDLRTGEIIALESLARFTAEPILPPNVWLAAADQAGLRVALEHQLLAAALGLLGNIPEHIALSVNLSPAAATDAGLASLLDGVPLHRLVLEITDHRQLDDYEPLSEALSPLRTSGLRIAVDDSGHGLTSLQRVAQLAPSFMKLNRTLTRDIDRDPTKRALAYALTAFAAQIGSSIVAEGLETEAELQALRALGAPYGQGYLLAHPRSLSELQLGAPLSLPPGDPAGATPGPALELGAIARDDFHEAARVALRMLGRAHPSSTFAVAHLDYARRRHTVIASRGTHAEQLEPGRSMPIEQTMSFHMVAGRGPRLCADVDADVVYGALPLARELEAGSYAGVPLELPDGTRMGALFGVDRRPRAFSSDDLPLLTAIATVLGTVLTQQSGGGRDRGELLHYLRELARTDAMTGVLNRPGFAEFLDDELQRPAGRRQGAFVGVEVEDLDSLREQYGRTVADLALKDLAAALRTSAEALDPVGRLSDSRFGVLLLCDAHQVAVPRLIQGLTSRLADFMARREITMSVRAGAVALSDVTRRADAWPRAAAAAARIA